MTETETMTEQQTEEMMMADRVTDFIVASRRGDMATLRSMLRDGSVCVDAQAEDGFTALRVACLRRNMEVVSFLREMGADATLRDSVCVSPVLHARNTNDYEMVRLLCAPPRKCFSEVAIDVTSLSLHDDAEGVSAGECSVCFEACQLVRLTSCGHAFCEECLVSWLVAQLEGGQPVCPHQACKRDVCFHDMQKFVAARDPAAFARYDRTITQQALSRDPEWMWCQRCGSGGFGFDRSGETACSDRMCPDCDYSVCTECLLPGHAGVTCAKNWEVVSDNDASVDEVRYAKYFKRFARNCPQCTAPTERSGGCSHMTCRECKHQWCWLCRGPYQGKYTFGSKCPCPQKD
eukprot:TRINITY_DN12601_c0_g1_i2.p2 TRINITY_DN12601_c0_g1~~TRINITY_DN12601_c0_g1_i2.p2  ORF type:complete len:348 (+),score=71.39 TRINITY_DN12601_c0_g1_i2:110-1153(+)